MANIGLVYAGGLSKGAYQIGFVDALLNYIDYKDIKGISGASIGALNAYALAAKKTEVAYDYWMNFHCPNLMILYKRFLINRLLNKTVDALIDDNDYLHCPVYVSGLSVFPTWNFKYYLMKDDYQSDWKKLLSGIIVFPIVAGVPRRFKHRLYVDGGIVDNIPVQPLFRQTDIDLIIVMHFDPKYKLDQEYLNSDKIILEIDLSVCNGYIKSTFNFSNDLIKTMYQSAYDYGMALFEKLFQNGLDDKKTIASVAEKHMSEEREIRALYANLDAIPTKLNRVFKRQQKKDNVVKRI